jgi:hypothetical protein
VQAGRVQGEGAVRIDGLGSRPCGTISAPAPEPSVPSGKFMAGAAGSCSIAEAEPASPNRTAVPRSVGSTRRLLVSPASSSTRRQPDWIKLAASHRP